MSETNGQHRPQPRVSFDDPEVLARMTVIGTLLGEPDALDDIRERRPDLDIDQLVLTAQIARMVSLELLHGSGTP